MTKRIPTVEQCLDITYQYEMLDNIRAHSFLVAKVAEVLLNGLAKADSWIEPKPDKNEVIAGALLHDIAKTMCIESDCRHAMEGKKICNELGYPTIGEMVEEHVVLKTFRDDLYSKGVFGPKEMVYYSDKRVRHDQIVSLSERLEYILERYGDSNPLKEEGIQRNFQQTLQFEKYLFDCLEFEPADISARIQQSQLQKVLNVYNPPRPTTT